MELVLFGLLKENPPGSATPASLTIKAMRIVHSSCALPSKGNMTTKGLVKKELVDVETYHSESLGKGDWIQLERISYKDNKDIERKWERCVRSKERESSIDAVDIHAILLTPEPELLLVVQYRPAIEGYCIEFPSGLIDAGEQTPILSAQRELKEETGYDIPASQFELFQIPIAYEPGLTNSCCYVAKVTIDTRKLSAPPIQSLEADEWSLQTISLPLNGLLDSLLQLQKSQKVKLVIDSRVHALATGLEYSKLYI